MNLVPGPGSLQSVPPSHGASPLLSVLWSPQVRHQYSGPQLGKLVWRDLPPPCMALQPPVQASSLRGFRDSTSSYFPLSLVRDLLTCTHSPHC